MSDNTAMETVIADAVDDAAFDASTPAPDTSTDTTPDAPAEEQPSLFDNKEAEAADPTASSAAVDEFEKRWGIPSKSVTGRENRIPHSRVKQMVTKAEAEAIAKLKKEHEAKWTGEFTPLETKVKDYEARLEKVAQFENILENDPRTFLGLLSQLPAYKDFFDHYNQLASGAQTPQQGQQAPKVPEGMPQPDQELPDGTKVYSMEGLQSLLQWQADNVEKRVTAQVKQHYAPIEQEWQQQQRMAQMVPVIEKQIAEARQWPNFPELEPEIVKLLKADQRLSLERAYVQAYQAHVVPKLTTDHNKVRTAVLAELRQKPVASSAPVSQVRPAPNALPENYTMDDVIRKALREQGLID